jgi:hypothetical protein
VGGVFGAALMVLFSPSQAHRVKAGLDCESGVLDPDARDALLETRTGENAKR